ncbi:MAG: NAD(P)H-hydrate dehydratase [Anaerolineales bacterium]|nr:NAD(P)H-hydrate dehydratase [Anaerolineales bacterium]
MQRPGYENDLSMQVKLVSVAEMIAIERASDAAGHTYADMMEHAGTGLAETVADLDIQAGTPSALGLVGTGNNGGDTIVALAHLAEEYGWRVTAYLMKPRPQDPLVDRLVHAGGTIVGPEEPGTYGNLEKLIPAHDVLLDGLLGTGIRLPLRESAAGLLAACRAVLADLDEPPLVIAVDCPSGVDCDSGDAAEEALAADVTVTMAAVKQGLLKVPAIGLVGELLLVGIGLPEGLEAWQAVRREVVHVEKVASLLPERPLDGHKGTFGTVLVIGGSAGYTGAPLLSGKAAYRAGAGLVTLAVPSPLHAALAGSFPEATWQLLEHEGGFVSAGAADQLSADSVRVSAYALGPGIGLQESCLAFVRDFLADLKEDSPLVVDADGLRLLASLEDWPRKLPLQAILTPHPGEMAALTGMSTAEIQADRIEVAEKYAAEWAHIGGLKGAGPVIESPGGHTRVLPVASPALAKAGSGDVLTGVIAGLLAQGVAPFDAALVGCWIHAHA